MIRSPKAFSFACCDVTSTARATCDHDVTTIDVITDRVHRMDCRKIVIYSRRQSYCILLRVFVVVQLVVRIEYIADEK